MLLLTASLGSVPWSVICLIASLILLAIAAFIGPPGPEPAPFYRRLNFGWAGLFFYVLAVAVS